MAEESLSQRIRRLVREAKENNDLMESLEEEMREAEWEKRAILLKPHYVSDPPVTSDLVTVLKRQKANPRLLWVGDPEDLRLIPGVVPSTATSVEQTCADTRKVLKDASSTQTGIDSSSFQESVVILGMGCFWCAEDVFRGLMSHVAASGSPDFRSGIVGLSVGYCGGVTRSPSCELVTTGLTNHAECLKIIYDSGKLSLSDILRYFWICHDSTSEFCQGSDVGTQYRSLIVCEDKVQERQANESKKRFQDCLARWCASGSTFSDSKTLENLQMYVEKPRVVSTEVYSMNSSSKREEECIFYAAEEQHQGYEEKRFRENPNAKAYHGLKPLPIPLEFLTEL